MLFVRSQTERARWPVGRRPLPAGRPVTHAIKGIVAPPGANSSVPARHLWGERARRRSRRCPARRQRPALAAEPLAGRRRLAAWAQVLPTIRRCLRAKRRPAGKGGNRRPSGRGVVCGDSPLSAAVHGPMPSFSSCWKQGIRRVPKSSVKLASIRRETFTNPSQGRLFTP
jgi:hypothetical protein